MEITTQHVSELITELQKKLKSVQEDKALDTDWNAWFAHVQYLKSHLDEQLKASTGRFRTDTSNVSSTAKHAAVLDSINSFKSQIQKSD
jgi:hypothetical protein